MIFQLVKMKEYLKLLDQHTSCLPNERADDSEPQADRFIRLACLDYRSDHSTRRVQARAILSQDPSILQTNIYTAATVGDLRLVEKMLDENPRLANLRGGPHNWEPLLYAAYSRLDSEVKDHSTLAVARLLVERERPNADFLDGRISTLGLAPLAKGARTYSTRTPVLLSAGPLLLTLGAPNIAEIYNACSRRRVTSSAS